MVSGVNDRWSGVFRVDSLGRHEYTIEAWVDRFRTWLRDLSKKTQAGQDVASELLEGAEFVQQAAGRARGPEAEWFRQRAGVLKGQEVQAARIQAALDPQLAAAMSHYPDRRGSRTYERTLGVIVERERARYGAWYEMFPRSAAAEPGQARNLQGPRVAAPVRRLDGLRRPVPAPDPSDRPELPQGPE